VRWKDVTHILDGISIEESSEDQHFLASPCDYSYKAEVAEEFAGDSSEAWITQGFTARDEEGRTVLLGRGGSDTSAACLAATIGATELQIWTDVPGLFTSNPSDIDDVRLLKFATYDEAEALASLGAKVLHPRCLEPVRDANIPVRICWTEEPNVQGTVIEADSDRETTGFKAVTSRSDICLLRMSKPASWQPVGFMKDVATCFEELGLSMDLLASSPSEIRATIDLSAFPGYEEVEEELLGSLGEFCEVTVYKNIECISLVGNGVSTEIDQIGVTLPVLRDASVHMVSYAANDAHLSYVVDKDQASNLVHLAHQALFAQRDGCEVFGPSWSALKDEPEDVLPERSPAVDTRSQVRA
jgi:diaminopimelate decarboxylase/aspartate kinase